MQRSSNLPKLLLERKSALTNLSRLVEFPLTVLCAPAGYGKSTLAAAVLRNMNMSHIWIELNDKHGQIARFYCDLIITIRKLFPKFAPDFKMDPFQMAWPDPETTLELLISELSQIECQLITVFDYSFKDREIISWAAMEKFLELLPEQVHVVLLCRERPALNLSRWRLEGRLLEMGPKELALSVEETGQFLNTVSGKKFSGESILNIHQLSEGWIAGLQLIALRLQKESDGELALSKMDWNHLFLFEYMIEEVLNTLTIEQKEFLLMTSILPVLHPELCIAVTGMENSTTILSQLFDRNVFVTRSGFGEYGRYHRLFSEGLQGLLREWKPGLITRLHQKAAKWNLSRNLIEAAFEHALEANDDETLEALAARALENIFRNSDFIALAKQALRIPEDLTKEKPNLAVFLAWALFHMGREAEGRIHLERAHRSVRNLHQSAASELTQRKILSHLFYLRGILLRLNGDIAHSVQLAYRAFALVLPEDRFLKASIQVQIGIGSFLTNRIPEAIAALKDAMEYAEASEHHLAFFGSGYTLSQIYYLQGCVEKQNQLHLTMMSYRLRSEAHAGPAAGYAFIAEARSLLFRGMLKEARNAAERGIGLGHKGDNIRILNYGYATMAMVLAVEGNFESAEKRIVDAEIVARRNRMHWGADLDDLNAFRIRIQIKSGKKVSADHWMERQKSRIKIPGLNEWDAARTVIRFHIENQHSSESLEIIEVWEAFIQQIGLPIILVELEILKSIALWGLAEKDQAFTVLQSALAKAESFQLTGLTQGLANYFQPILKMPTKHSGYGNTDVTHVNTEISTNLSDRELEVLHAMREGKSNKEIANLLFVAPSTVKTHLKNIFIKLQVTNRTRAVTFAEETGLLK